MQSSAKSIFDKSIFDKSIFDKSIFDPITINGVQLPNRVVKSAMAEGHCDEKGFPLPPLVKLYERWAKGGVGLCITGMAHLFDGYSFTDKEIGLYDDALIEPLRPIPAAVHRHGGRVFVQLCHAPPQIPRKKSKILGAVAPSKGFCRTNLRFARALTDEEIRGIAHAFGAAARRARLAGFDGVQLHGAHGYLISRFISPLHNRRDDEWGGDFDRRLAFLREITAAIHAEVGRDFPLTIKLNASDADPRGGLDLETSLQIGKQLELWGFDAIEVSAGTGDVGLGFLPTRGEIPMDLAQKWLKAEFPFLRPILPFYKATVRKVAQQVALTKEAYHLEESIRFAEELSIPVMCVGGIRSLNTAQRIVQETPISMISIARPLVRQPGLINAWREGRKTTASCTSCNRCFVAIGSGQTLRCRTVKVDSQ